MTHVIGTVTKEVAVTDGYFNFPIQQGIDREGFWYTYIPANVGNSLLAAAIKPYRYSSALDLLGTANTMVMEGTVPLLTEPWDGSNVLYHGGTIVHVGAGINDITGTVEDDAFFFNHLGTLSTAPDDDAFYWDRAFLRDGSSEWEYYQYHKHLPTVYPKYENGRIVLGAGNFIVPEDKAYASLIHTSVKVSNVDYQSVLARIHTPSVGGAHNSHNDITLPSVANRNYQAGGIMKGVGDRFHAFYISADGAQWRVYNRTYIDASASFTAQVDLGVFDLADPVLTPGTGSGSCHFYPIRVSAGDVLGNKIYFPVILNNATSGFDLEIWSFNSNDTIAGGSLIRQVLLSGQTSRPDAQCVTVGSQLHVLCSNINAGGASLFVYDGTTWEEATSRPITNGIADPIRVHGFRYNTEDVKFYALISGTNTGTGNYTGPGLYSFNLVGDFAGYKHLDYDATNNAFIEKGPLSAGHLSYSITDGTISRSTLTEPEGIGSSVRILDYTPIKPNFFNKKKVDVGGDEFIFRGIKLKDNRKLLLGRVENLPYGKVRGTSADALATIVRQDNVTMYHYAYGGIDGDAVDPSVGVLGDDYIVNGVQSEIDPNKVWIVGYTKSEFVEKKDIKIHGFCRNSSDSPNFLAWNDIITDSTGSMYAVGSNGTEFGILTKYSENYIMQWQLQIGYDVDTSGEAVAIDSLNNIYVSGNVADGSVYVSKINSQTGAEIWTKTYGVNLQTFTSGGITVVTKNSIDYLVIAAVNGTSTTFVVLDTAGTITEQFVVSNLVSKRIRKQDSSTLGRFTFAGTDGSTAGKFGVCEVAGATRFVRWTSTFGTEAREMRDIDGGSTPGFIVVGKTGTSGSILKVTVSEAGDSHTVTKSWARTLSSSEFYGVVTTPYTETTRYAYVTGMTPTGGTAAMGMNEGIIAAYDNTGTLIWQNVFGHDMNESLNAITIDVTGYNIIVSGWSESHSSARDAIVFRCENGGFGTGVYHLSGNAGVPYYYLKSALVDASNATAITNLTAPLNSVGSVTIDSNKVFTYSDSGHLIRNFDGAYGENGTFQLFFGYIDLPVLQAFINTEEYKENQAAGRLVNYVPSAFKLWQVGTVGDGSADDGNIFGYDIIESSDGTVYVIGQTSGDVRKTNTGASGVYDYLLVRFDPVTEEIEYYQNGTDRDEETYALCELHDGRIAFTGRTTGDLGGVEQGGYDIFLGIYNPTNDVIDYYSTGTGLDDRGMNIHSISNTELAITYTSYGALGGTNFGSEDVGIIKFNYVTDTWGTAYQLGTSGADIIIQNGKPSVLLEDGRIAVVFSTAGALEMGMGSSGFLDIGLGILDFDTAEWTTAQVGSQSSEISTSVTAVGERLLITGYITDSFSDEGEGIIVEVDIQFGIGAKESSL